MSDATVFRCKVCDALLKVEDIDLRSGVATCGYCHAVMRFNELVAHGSGMPAERPRVELPSRFTIEDFGGELKITRRWFSPAVFFLVFFCAIWDGFLVFWYSIGISTGAPLMMFVFPLIHVAVGVGLTYFCLTMFVNRTVVTVGRGLLGITHGPLPWPGSGTYETDDLQQFYCEEKIQSTKNGTKRTYVLNAVTRDGSKKKLLKGLADSDQALFLEQQLESYLGIDDAPVTGELSR